MSLYGVMRTSTSGMNAQASRISAVAENVANANTTGYKAVRTEFSSIFIESNVSSYNSGSVDTNIRRLISNQGTLTPTNSVTDLAISGDGFFVVQDDSGANFMTRAGSFLLDSEGDLVNSAGFTLMGYPLNPSLSSIAVNGYSGMVPVSMSNLSLSATPSTTGEFTANLPSEAPVVSAANRPSVNSATAAFTAKSSLVVFGNLGQEETIDIFYTKLGTNTWEATAFDSAAAGPSGGFPYSSGPLASVVLNFDPSDGTLLASSAQSMTLNVPGGTSLSLDLSQQTQLAANYTVLSANVNGNAASSSSVVEVSEKGVVYVSFENGLRRPVYQIPLATVQSPDNMESLSGNIYATTSRSGDVRIGFPQDPGFGKVISGVLEQSTADIAAEFTDMIDAQRGYTANSKVFQTGAELMDVLVNLKR